MNKDKKESKAEIEERCRKKEAELEAKDDEIDGLADGLKQLLRERAEIVRGMDSEEEEWLNWPHEVYEMKLVKVDTSAWINQWIK